MALWHGRSAKKISGGRYRPQRKKRRTEIGREAADTTIGSRTAKTLRVTGGASKVSLRAALEANVVNPKTGECKKAKILTVVENAANPHFVRRNIITRGAIINTELGKAKVTSRPGQDGSVNAVLVE